MNREQSESREWLTKNECKIDFSDNVHFLFVIIIIIITIIIIINNIYITFTICTIINALQYIRIEQKKKKHTCT